MRSFLLDTGHTPNFQNEFLGHFYGYFYEFPRNFLELLNKKMFASIYHFKLMTNLSTRCLDIS